MATELAAAPLLEQIQALATSAGISLQATSPVPPPVKKRRPSPG